jgi:hypothetical protein
MKLFKLDAMDTGKRCQQFPWLSVFGHSIWSLCGVQGFLAVLRGTHEVAGQAHWVMLKLLILKSNKCE